MRFEEGTVWLAQAAIAELFQTTPQNITMHLAAIYEEGELLEERTCKDYLQVRREGARDVRRSLKHYNLEAILAVGYRVRSARGTQFRQWATARLDEYLVKGFVLDDQRLKNPPGPGVPDYFDELLERIRDIRASERRMYLRVRDILALAADYDAHEAAPVEIGTSVVRDAPLPLSQILDVVNERFGTQFDEEDRLFLMQIKEKACRDARVVQTALANPLDKFQIGIRKSIEDFMIQRMAENDAIVTRYMDDEEFQSKLFAALAREVFESVHRREEQLAGSKQMPL